jgi:hypothetical protein
VGTQSNGAKAEEAMPAEPPKEFLFGGFFIDICKKELIRGILFKDGSIKIETKYESSSIFDAKHPQMGGRLSTYGDAKQ